MFDSNCNNTNGPVTRWAVIQKEIDSINCLISTNGRYPERSEYINVYSKMTRDELEEWKQKLWLALINPEIKDYAAEPERKDDV